MKVKPQCFECIKQLIYRTCALSTDNAELREKAQRAAIKILLDNYGRDSVPAKISTIFHKKIREITGNDDPYKKQKEKEMENSRSCIEIARKNAGEDMYGAIRLSAIGNSIDYFRDFEEVKKDLTGDFSFAVDDISKALPIIDELASKRDTVLFLSDNAGEFFFDMPLISLMEERDIKVFYSIKSAPVQNDLSLSDFGKFGDLRKPANVLLSGNASVGFSLEEASDEFREVFRQSALIIAKGMGHYETLTEIKCGKPVLYLLKAKCAPVAGSLNVKEGSFAAKLLFQ